MIRWFTENGVAANLLAGIIIIAGFFIASTMKLELFPNLDLDTIKINVAYPGAAPSEVETGIIELIEDRIQSIEGIKKINAYASENIGTVVVEVERNYHKRNIRDQIKSEIDTINNFPEQAEEPRVEEINIRNEVISLAIYGDTDPLTLKKVAEYIKDELNYQKGISQVDIKAYPELEISIFVSENILNQYNITLETVAQAIRSEAVDIPGGIIKSEEGEILIRTKAKAYTQSDFEAIPVLKQADGSTLRISDLGTVVDGFSDTKITSLFNGQRSIMLRIFAVGNQNALEVSEAVREFAADIQSTLPEGIHIEPFRDFTFYLKSRLNMLIENGIYGLILVFIILTLFLRPSLAFFVMLGIPISFLGAFIVLPVFDVTINLASLFGFILVLGIVVDDAIIVGESIFTEFQKQGGPGVNASVIGAKRVSIPVTFAVLTTIVAFIPILTIPGFLGKFFFPIPIVVIATLIGSLVESKLVLPYHLTLCKVGVGKQKELNWFQKKQRAIANALEKFIDEKYRPVLIKSIERRYTLLASFVAILMIMLSFLIGNHLKFVFFPPVPSDYILAKVTMPEGTPYHVTAKAIEQMEDGLNKLSQEIIDMGYGQPFDNSVVTIGGTNFDGSGGPMGEGFSMRSENVGEIAVELYKREDLANGGDIEALSAPNLANRWRELIGSIVGAEEISFDANAAGSAGEAINIQISGKDLNRLEIVSEKLKTLLYDYEGIFDIKDSFRGGKSEVQIKLKLSAESLGLTQSSVGSQVRAAFYGIEAQRIQRASDDIKVKVRYPKDESIRSQNLDNLLIQLPSGEKVPLNTVADYSIEEGFSSIRRIDQRRVINITADADKSKANLELIRADLIGNKNEKGSIDEILATYPEIKWSFEGEAREQSDIFSSLIQKTLLALFIIYALLAIPLKSYIQPVIVMSVIPFGLIGAIGGHFILNQPVSILSILGFVALTGVVVNDSLVMIDYINKKRLEGTGIKEAIEQSGVARFRPILLTSLTTFAGLLPILFETSLQAQFLIPMAISLSFGVLFATFITLLLVPAFYTMVNDFLSLFSSDSDQA